MQNRKLTRILARTVFGCVLVVALLTVAGCAAGDDDALSTPNVNILAPTATSLVARVEVMVIVVTPTAASTEASNQEGGSTQSGNEEGQQSAQAQDQQPPDQQEGQQQQDQQGQQQQTGQTSNQQLINTGEQVYAENCATCHGEGGEGSDIYPALNGSGLLTLGDPSQAIDIVLHGRAEMPSFEDTLSNQQIAAVLSYERNSWNNDASVVRVEQVREMRQGGSGGQASQAAPAGEASASDSESTPASSSAEQATGGENSSGENSSGENLAGENSSSESSSQETTAQAQPTEGATPSASASPTAEPPADVRETQAGPTWTPAPEVTPLLPATAPAETTSAEATGTPMPASADDGAQAAVEPPLRWTPSRMVTPLLPSTMASGDGERTGEATPSATQTQTAQEAPATSQAEGTTTPATDQAAADTTAEDMLAQGAEIYSAQCAECHQPNGEGTSLYPSLRASDMLTADDPSAAIDLVLHGQGQMPAFADILSDAEIAAVLTHERNSWGNNASPVTVEMVQTVKE